MKSFQLASVLAVIAGLGISLTAKSQLITSDDETIAAKEKAAYSLLTDFKNEGKYDEALPHLHWLLQNNPGIHRSVYIYGAQILNALIQLETSPLRSEMLKDSCMIVYDMRINYFGDEANVLNRKMDKAYRYFAKDKNQYGWMLETYAKVFSNNEEAEILNANTIGYFDILRRSNNTISRKSTTEILDIFYKIIATINTKLALGKHEEQLSIYKSKVVKFLPEMIDIDCAFLSNEFSTKIQSDPDDITLSKLAVHLSEKYDCPLSESLMMAMENVFQLNSSFEAALAIAKGKVQLNQLDEALKYYGLALDLTEDYETKAKIATKIGHVYSNQQDFIKARNYYLQALEFNPNYKQAHGFIGDLYFNSFKNCQGKKSQLDDRAVFIAAYDKYEKAGDINAMRRAKAQFPSASDIHGDLKKLETNTL